MRLDPVKVCCEDPSTRIKDAGMAIRHSQGRILFYTAGSRNGLEGVVGHDSKKLTLRKRHVFIIEKYVEDAKQEDKDVPDLVESIMRPTRLAKEGLRGILLKMSQYRPEIIKIRVSTFWMSIKSTDSRRRPTQPSRLVSFKPMKALQSRKNQKICGF